MQKERWTKADRLIAEGMQLLGVKAVCKMRLISDRKIVFWQQENKEGNEMGGLPKGAFADLEVGETVFLQEILDKEKRS